MSTIGVKYHNEDIHFIIRKPMEQTVKSPRYKSKWTKSQTKQADRTERSETIETTEKSERTETVEKIEKTPKFEKIESFYKAERKKYNGHQTFGLAHYEAPDFKNYLKKAKPRIISSPVKHTTKRERKCTKSCKTVYLPRITNEIKTEVKRKNFVKENIKKAIALQPKVPIPRKVETPRGTSKDMAHLLQMIKIRESEAYGKIPKYLCERKKQWEREKEMQIIQKQAIEKKREEMGIGTMGMGENYYMINQETRQRILDGLKENWNELSKQFLKLPVMTDTWPKIKRKMCLEKEIEQLERDIKLVECHPFIYLERHDRRTIENLEQAGQNMLGKKQKEEEKEEKKEEKEEEKVPKEEAKPEAEKLLVENPERESLYPAQAIIEEKKEEKEVKQTNDYSC